MSGSLAGSPNLTEAGVLSRRLYIVSLTIALGACLNVPEYFNELLGFPLPQTGYFLPYLAPFSFIFTLAVLRLRYSQMPVCVPFGRLDVGLIAVLGLWLGQELFWSVTDGTPFNMNAILPLSWSYFFYLVLRIHQQDSGFHSIAATALIFIVGTLSVFHLALHAVVLFQQASGYPVFQLCQKQ